MYEIRGSSLKLGEYLEFHRHTPHRLSGIYRRCFPFLGCPGGRFKLYGCHAPLGINFPFSPNFFFFCCGVGVARILTKSQLAKIRCNVLLWPSSLVAPHMVVSPLVICKSYEAQDTGQRTLVAGHWTLVTGRWSQDTGPWTLDPGHGTLESTTLGCTWACMRAAV